MCLALPVPSSRWKHDPKKRLSPVGSELQVSSDPRGRIRSAGRLLVELRSPWGVIWHRYGDWDPERNRGVKVRESYLTLEQREKVSRSDGDSVSLERPHPLAAPVPPSPLATPVPPSPRP